MAAANKRYAVNTPVENRITRYILAENPSDAIEKARAGNFEHEEEIDTGDFTPIDPTPGYVYEVKELKGTGHCDDWEDLNESSSVSFRALLADGTPATPRIINRWNDHCEQFYKPSKATATEGEGVSMSRVQEAFDVVKSDTASAAVRAGAAEFSDMVREPVSASLLKEIGIENAMARQWVGSFLNTAIGEGAFSYVLGLAVPLIGAAIPNEMSQTVAATLGKELRVAGQAAMLRPLIRALRAPLTEFIQTKISAKTLVRVEATGEKKRTAVTGEAVEATAEKATARASARR